MPVKDKLSSRAALEEVLLRAHIELVKASRRGTQNNPNIFLREMGALHDNTTRSDIPDYLKKALADNTSSMLAYLHSQGFTIIPKDANNDR